MPLPTMPLSRLRSLVAPYALKCPNMLIDQHLRRAAIDFCEATRIWREMLTVTFDEQDEAIVAPDHAALYEIESAEFSDGGDTWCLTPIPFGETTSHDRDATIEGQPRFFTQSSANTITLIPFMAGTVTISAILTPIAIPKFGVAGATTEQAIQNVIPKFLADQHGQHIANGAIFTLLSMPRQPWTDPNVAATHMHLFERAKNKHFRANSRGQQRAPLRTRPHWV